MEKGISMSTQFAINIIPEKLKKEIKRYILEISSKEAYVFKSKKEIEETLKEFLNTYDKRLDEFDRESLMNYQGLGFRKINSILRGVWDYEKNGKLTPEIKREAHIMSENLRIALLKTPTLPFTMKTYRGVSIATFYQSGITKLEELEYLKGKYFYEEGFTSTSLIRERSFFINKPSFGEDCNIEIEYIIPEDSCDGVLLDATITGYETNQSEFLINSSTLFQVMDVEVDKNTNTARIKLFLIPQKLWNPLDYEQERREEFHL